jgi:signal transduction histidine kinase
VEAVLSVRDEGIGISEEDRVHLFSSFFRGKNAVNIQGTGLGLHIVKRYLDLLKGEVFLESELGKGTTIRFVIPVKHS